MNCILRTTTVDLVVRRSLLDGRVVVVVVREDTVVAVSR